MGIKEKFDALKTAKLKRNLRVLKDAREKIVKGWTQGPFAADALGVPLSPTHPNACKWCAMGAVSAAAGPGEYGRIRDVLNDEVYSLHGFPTMVCFNEDSDTTKEMVLAVFDNAINRLTEKVNDVTS